MTGVTAAPQLVSFPTQDNGIVYANAYGTGGSGLVLAHGARFNKASWQKQAEALDKAGFRVLAIDFRGYGQPRAGANSRSNSDDLYLDVLAAVRYLREKGAKSVSVLGASMGGGAAAEAAVNSGPDEIDRLVLLAPVPIHDPGKIKGRKLFISSRGDALVDRIRAQYESAPEPKDLLLLDGSAHAQFLFETDQGERLMHEIVQFLSSP